MYSPEPRDTNRFSGPINNEKDHEIYFSTSVDRFSKKPSAAIFDNANASNVQCH